METSNVYLTPCFGGEREGTVPTMVALQVMEDCIAKGVKFVHLLTAGFTETGRPEHAVKFLRSLLDKGQARQMRFFLDIQTHFFYSYQMFN